MNQTPFTQQEQQVAHNAPSLPPLISADEFLASAPKMSITSSVILPSNGQTKSQPLSLPPSTPPDNPVVTALKARGLYKKPSGSGWHSLTCPWITQHTNAKDDGAYYSEPNDQYSIGGFKCHHNHCSKRTVRQLLEYLEISIAEVVGGKK